MHQGAADPAADAAQENQVWGPGECPGGASAGWASQECPGAQVVKPIGPVVNGALYPQWGLTPILPQGNQLRKMLLQNYLQNRKSTSRGDLPDPMGTGQYRLLLPLGPPFCSPVPPPLPQLSPPAGLDPDWSAIAATQCRLDKEGATKLVCDLITSTKNEKIFQESIGLAIRLLDGGNTEIQVWGAWGLDMLSFASLPFLEEVGLELGTEGQGGCERGEQEA